MQCLFDRAPAAQLAPAAGTMRRYGLQECLNFIASEIRKSFGPLWKPDSTDDEEQRTRYRRGLRLHWRARELGDRERLMGAFSIANACLFTVLC